MCYSCKSSLPSNFKKGEIMNRIKYITLAIFLVLTGCANIESGIANQDSTIDLVVEAPGYSQSQIYTYTKNWLAATFASAKAVIQNDDRESGTIIGNVIVEYICTDSILECNFNMTKRLEGTMRVDIKNEKFKMSFSNMSIYDSSDQGARSIYKRELEGDARRAVAKTAESLRSSFNKEQTKTNW